MKKILGVLLLCLNVSMFFSQNINHEDVVKVKFSIEQKDNEAFVVAKITIIPGWHINSFKLPKNSYAIQTDIKLNPQGNFVIKELIEPKPNQYIDEDLGDMQSHHKGTLVMKRKILINSVTDFNLTGVFSFQVCDEAGKCLMPHEYPISLKVKGSAIVTAVDSITTVSKDTNSIMPDQGAKIDNTSNKNQKKESKKSMLLIFVISFLSGFAALLTPCVFPMIPMTVSYFTKNSKSRAAGIRNAILYGISIIAIYVILGTIVTTIFGPSALNALSTNVYFNIIFFLLLVIFAVSFLGAFEIMLPSSWQNKANDASYKSGILYLFV